VTLTFLPLLVKSKEPRVLFITSGASSLTEASDPSSRTYRVPEAGEFFVQSPSFVSLIISP
jgi:hypothetical protein